MTTDNETNGKSALTLQEQMVLDSLNRTYANSVQTGDHLDNKATALLQAGGLVIALTGVVKIPEFVATPTLWAGLGIAIAFLAFAGMILLAVLAWRPSSFAHAGGIEWDEIFDDYLLVDAEKCFNQVLSDLTSAIQQNFARNTAKSRYVHLSALLFAAQVVGVLVLALSA